MNMNGGECTISGDKCSLVRTMSVVLFLCNASTAAQVGSGKHHVRCDVYNT